MSIIDLIKTSLYSIKAHKLRVFLTMIGIIIGISSTVTVKSIGDGLSDYVSKSMESTNSNKYQVIFEPENEDASYMDWFVDYDINDVKSIKGVTDVEVMTDLGSQELQTANITFFSKNFFTILTYPMGNANMQYGRNLTESDEGKNRIVINQDVAEALFDTVESSIGKGVSFNGEIYEVIGVTKSSTNFMDYMMSMYCFIPKENLYSMNSSDYISSICVYVDPKYDKDEVLDEVTKILKKNHISMEGDYKVQDSSKEVEILTTMIGAITTFVSAITGIALFVGGVGVMNIMYVSVTERKREIGIRRAIGAKPRTILFQFLFEAIIVTGVGGIIGIVLGYVLGSAVSTFIPIEGFKAVLTAKTLIGSASISVLVGVIFGIIPARNASKMDPIKAIYQ
ncbi:MAG: ABC transporter permease [Clostridium sp.]|nr:ABC transporter permease [Clostridium sp.]